MGQDQSQLSFLFVGALVTGLITLLVNLLAQVYKDRRHEERARRTFKLILKLELRSCAKTLNDLRNSWEDRRYFAFRHLNVLERSARVIEEKKSDAYRLEDPALQEKFTILSTDFSLWLSDVNGIENMLITSVNNSAKTDEDKKQDRTFVEQERQNRLIELYELKRRFEEMITELKTD